MQQEEQGKRESSCEGQRVRVYSSTVSARPNTSILTLRTVSSQQYGGRSHSIDSRHNTRTKIYTLNYTWFLTLPYPFYHTFFSFVPVIKASKSVCIMDYELTFEHRTQRVFQVSLSCGNPEFITDIAPQGRDTAVDI